VFAEFPGSLVFSTQLSLQCWQLTTWQQPKALVHHNSDILTLSKASTPAATPTIGYSTYFGFSNPHSPLARQGIQKGSACFKTSVSNFELISGRLNRIAANQHGEQLVVISEDMV